MEALASAIASNPAPTANESDEFKDPGGDDIQFHNSCLEEIDRYRRLDEWIPSYHNIVSQTALDCKRILAKSHIIPTNPIDFLQYTPDGTSDLLRLKAFSNLMSLGLSSNAAILRYFLFVLGTDPSPYVREQMLHLLGKTLGSIAIGEFSKPTTASTAAQDGLIVEIEASTEARKAELARKQTVVGALQALKDELSNNTVLQEGLWMAITSPNISLQQMWQLLEICDWLYIPHTSILISLRLPRYPRCSYNRGWMSFHSTGRVRTTLIPKKLEKPKDPIKIRFGSSSGVASAPTPGSQRPASPVIKRENSVSEASGVTAPPKKTFLKPPKPPATVQRVDSTGSIGSGAESPSQAGGEKPKPKLLLKMKIGGGGRGGSASASPAP